MDGTRALSVAEPLTDRELDILRLIAQGLSNREIGRQLVLAPGTVKWYNKQIFSKLGVHSRTQAIAHARETGLLGAQPAALPRAVAAPVHNNLPAQVSSFVGREREMAEVQRLLAANRLLTLTGPPGTGKTRLGLQVATALLGRFADGVFFVDLAPIRDPQLLSSTVAQALGIRLVTGQSLLETLRNDLRPKCLLLLLDNFEQIIEAAPLVSELLSASSGLKVLITSRQALHVTGEQEYPVPPLALPEPGQPESLPALSRYEAVQLFMQRARAVKPDFVLSDGNAAAIAEICVRLDGLPLAIELAAARSKFLSPEIMRSRLQSRLGTLTVGSRDLPARLRTLRSAIDWSYDLLDVGEQALFARLAVFHGGCTVEAVETVCSDGLPMSILDGLESLLDKSLLWQKPGPDGELRFRMLETIHEYARERLEASGAGEAVRKRHAEYVVALVERAAPELQGPRQEHWSARLRAEHDNLRAALAWALAGGDAGLGLRLAGALRDFWYYGGDIAEGSQWLARALAAAGDAPTAWRGRALNAAGRLAYARGEHEAGRAYNTEALSLFRMLGDQVNSAWALVWLSSQMLASPGPHDEGIALCEEGLALFRALGDQPGLSMALNTLGELVRLDGDYERAERAYEECLAVSRRAGNRQREAIMLSNLAVVTHHRGNYGRAEALAREALVRFHELESGYFVALDLALLAGPVAAMGDPERAARLLGASEALLKAMGGELQPADRPEVERYVTSAREQIGPSAFEAAWAEGQAMSVEGALAYALGEFSE